MSKVCLINLFALVALGRVVLTGLQSGSVVKLDEDDLALALALDRHSDEAPGTVENCELHGFADDLDDKHFLVQTMAVPNCHCNEKLGRLFGYRQYQVWEHAAAALWTTQPCQMRLSQLPDRATACLPGAGFDHPALPELVRLTDRCDAVGALQKSTLVPSALGRWRRAEPRGRGCLSARDGEC